MNLFSVFSDPQDDPHLLLLNPPLPQGVFEPPELPLPPESGVFFSPILPHLGGPLFPQAMTFYHVKINLISQNLLLQILSIIYHENGLEFRLVFNSELSRSCILLNVFSGSDHLFPWLLLETKTSLYKCGYDQHTSALSIINK